MNDISLKLDQRTVQGKKADKIRKDGFVPSVVYGDKIDPILTQSPIIETIKAVRAAGKHTPVNLTIDGKKKLAIIKTIDIEPVKHQIRHIAFHAISRNDIITTDVPVVLVGQGESVAEKAGLVVLQAIDSIEIKAKPDDLPSVIELSIANLANEDDRLTVGDVKLPQGVEFADIEQDLELVIANVYEPGALQAANEAAGGEAEEEAEVAAEEAVEETPSESKPAESDKK